MTRVKSPAFQFYAAEFLADENVVLMSNQQVGCYIKLMAYCWREGSIPSEIDKIAKLCGEDGSAMAQLWLGISSCFDPAIDSPNRLQHPRLVKELAKQKAFKEERAESGKKGAEARWGKEKKEDGSANGSAKKQPKANDGSSSSSSSSNSSSARGTRLPADWSPSQDEIDFCASERPDLNPRSTGEQFRDYWVAQPGAKGLKTNWEATWRNWVRNQRSIKPINGHTSDSIFG